MLDGWYFGENVEPKVPDGKQPYDLQKITAPYDRQAQLLQITEEGKMAHQLCRVRNHSIQTVQTLARLESNIRFFFLCLIFMYFRTLDMIQKEKQSWFNSDEEPMISAERAKMIQEEKAAKMRKEAFDYAFQKFQLGAKSRKRKADLEALTKVRP